MSYNYKNYEKIISILLAILFLGVILYFDFFSLKVEEGFINASDKNASYKDDSSNPSFTPWPKDLVKRFNVYQATVGENNYQYNMRILEQQASAAEAEELLATNRWPWSDKVKQQYMDAVSHSPLIKIDSGEALDSAMKIYNENAIKQVLAYNTKEGKFLLYGIKTGPNDFDTIKCSGDLGNSVLQKNVFNSYNLWNGYKNTETTTIKNEDIPSQVSGFSFVNGPCNPCVAINEYPDHSCPFKINVNDGSGSKTSSIWSDLWHL